MESNNDYFKGTDLQNDEHYNYKKLVQDLSDHTKASGTYNKWTNYRDEDLTHHIEWFLEKVEYEIDMYNSTNIELLNYLDESFDNYMDNENERMYDRFVEGFYGG